MVRSGSDNDSLTAVFCPISEVMGGEEHEEEPVEHSESEMVLVVERQICKSKIGIDTSREEVLAGRRTEMEDMENHHVFDEVLEGDAVKTKLIRAKWLNDDRGDQADWTCLHPI